MTNNTDAPGALLAAVDLGSNSFRLEIGRFDGGQIQRVDYLKETVRQGAGLDENRNLTENSIAHGIQCLERFGETIKGFPAKNVRAVATQTLREAKNRDLFLSLAKKALGYDVEVISGVEEARLIYQGVSRLLPQSDERRLVIDIGGRSTEFILGQQFEAKSTESIRVGSVTWSLKFFPNGDLTEECFYRAQIAAESFLDIITSDYQQRYWDVAYGASGTVGAIADILTTAGFPKECITAKGLAWLRNELLRAKHVDKLKIENLKEDRKSVIGGGVSIMLAIFDLLKIDTLAVANGALRHGLLYDIADINTNTSSDLREASIKRLSKRFDINMPQAKNVNDTALYFFNAIANDLHKAPTEVEDLRKTLCWAARLHGIGNAISHINSHKHGAYILDNTELMGFAQNELHRLSLLVLGNYGKIKKIEADFNDIGLVTQLVCLRLAVIFCHAHNKPALKYVQLTLSGASILLSASPTWIKKFPQTAYLLEEEIIAWQKTDWNFIFSITNE